MPVIDRAAPHRVRLLQAMAAEVAEKGYAAVTVADVVAAAAVSKRTFYEHFSTKQECLLACFAEASDLVRDQLLAATADVADESGRLRAGVDAYFVALDQNPQLAVALLVETQAAGTPGRELRREKNEQFAELIRALAGERLDGPLAIALVGGLNELTLTHAENSPHLPFRTLAPAAHRFVAAVLGRECEQGHDHGHDHHRDHDHDHDPEADRAPG